MRTWHLELAVVVVALSCVAFATGGSPIEWLGVGAVSLSFAHAQVANRLSEREATRERPAVDCHRWDRRYLIGKESLWFLYFVVHGAWSALAGVGLFLLYAPWRSFWRRRHPMQAVTA